MDGDFYMMLHDWMKEDSLDVAYKIGIEANRYEYACTLSLSPSLNPARGTPYGVQ